MRIACTGFVSEKGGSVAAANALLLCSLLDRGIEVDFFSKPSFVDPRSIVGERPGFRFIPVTNRVLNFVRARSENIPVISTVTGIADAYSYNQLVVRIVRHEHQRRHYDLVLWLGDYSRGSVPSLPAISFVQGPPGTDARSLLARYEEIRSLAGPVQAIKWQMLARLRLSKLGEPPFHNSHHFVVGSHQSFRTLRSLYRVEPSRISVLPYPIDLELFKLPVTHTTAGQIRVLWLGRIVPRKRVDIFLNGAAQAIARGVDLKLTLVGSIGFISGYDRLIRSFPYPTRLERHEQIDRKDVPELFHQHHVLAQPSDEENFGSSVAEAQASGLPVIVGHTNGNADYLSSRDIHLADDRIGTFADAIVEMWQRHATGRMGDPRISRSLAEQHFDINRVTNGLTRILELTARKQDRSKYTFC